MAKSEFIVRIYHDGAEGFHAEHCVDKFSPEYPDATRFTSVRAAIAVAKQRSEEFHVNSGNVWENYGQADERLVGIAAGGHFNRNFCSRT